MKVKVILTVVIICTSVRLYAQSGKLFSADMELSNSLVNQVYQDRNEIIWIATEDGLNSYDGSKFTTYKHDETNPNSPLHNYVRSFFEDSKGNFYITYFNGIQLYDYATGIFQEIPLYLQIGDKFGAHVVTMLERQNGQIIIASSGHGLFELLIKDGKPEGLQFLEDDLGLSINAIFEDRDENLWVASDDKGLLRISKKNERKAFFSTDKAPKDIICCVCQDQSGEIFVGAMSTGLYKLDTNTDSFTHIAYPDSGTLPVKKLYVNTNNEILVGTDGNGMKVYSVDEQKFIHGQFNIMGFDFSKSKVHSIIEDNNRNVWLGIFQKGVLLIPARSGKFEYMGYKSATNNIIGSNCVMSVYKDSEGILWVGTDSDGLYKVGHTHEQNKHFPHTKQKDSTPSTILCIHEDSERNLWLGSYLQGLAKINRNTGKCEYIQNILDKNKFPIQRIYDLVEDDDKNLWIATMGGGLFYMNLRNNHVTPYDPDPSHNTGYAINNWIACLLKSRDNRLYLGTYDGLSFIDLKTKKVISDYNTQLLRGQPIYTIYEDAEAVLWIGTAQGLTSYNPDTKIMVTYTTNDGLPSNVICAIQGDQSGTLWLSTNNGISHFNPKNRSFTNYYSSDGLQSNEFSKNAAFTDHNGTIFFGGLNGITHFKPTDITVPEKVLNIRLTDFYIHDQAVKKGMKSGKYEIIDTSVIKADKFYLAHNDNSFTIEFSTMEFNNPERITYLYSMNNGQWVYLPPGTNRASFNNLAPGKYTFKVMAQDYNIQSEAKEIFIQISPVWYFSVWAKCLYLLVFLTIIALIIQQIYQRYKVRQRILEHVHAQEINEAKLQFFINISHEIRTPISLVMSPLRKLISTDKDSERQKDYFTMNRNVERVLSLINQLMDIRKIDKGQMKLRFQEVNMNLFLKDIYSIFEEQAKRKHIRLQFESDTEQLNAWIDPSHFDKVIINVISNAFRFTPENGEIMISLHNEITKSENGKIKHFFRIMISDSGVGINESEIERIFERFYQAKSKLVQSQEGTGIGLHLARSIVQLHHGHIEAENKKNEAGSRFIIDLPLGNEHLQPEQIESEPILSFKERYVETTMVTDTEPEKTKVKSKSKRYVLVVDDDKEIREYICRELSADFHTKAYPNGKEALDSILKKVPDLVISDVMMPEMDGITLCQRIKQNITINHVPVILLTAKTKEEDNLEGLNTGADAYMVKPFNIELLKKTAENIIKTREILRNNFSGNQQQKDKISKIVIKSPDDKLLERIMKVINKNIANTELSVEMIATEVGISRVHLHRKLKELTNQSTRDLIRNVRLQQAAELLSSKKLTVSEVAAATGFGNTAYFSSAFKEVYGMPPMAYMEERLKDGRDSDISGPGHIPGNKI